MKEFFRYTLATIAGIFITGIIGFFLLMIIFSAIIASSEKQVMVANQSMLLLKLDGQIVDRAPNDPFSGLNIPGLEQTRKLGLNHILSAIDKAKSDDRIKCIYLEVSFFNGGMAAAGEIRNALIDFRKECNKPVYAYSDLYDQKSYYLATAADKLVLNPRGVIDFRGLGGEITFYRKALEKLGVQVQVVRHGKFKAAVEPYMLDKMSLENREQTMVYLNSIWNQMLSAISEARRIPVDSLNKLADKVLTFRNAMDAMNAGMVDTLKYKDQVLDDLRKITGTSSKKGIPFVTVSEYARVPL